MHLPNTDTNVTAGRASSNTGSMTLGTHGPAIERVLPASVPYSAICLGPTHTTVSPNAHLAAQPSLPPNAGTVALIVRVPPHDQVAHHCSYGPQRDGSAGMVRDAEVDAVSVAVLSSAGCDELSELHRDKPRNLGAPHGWSATHHGTGRRA